MTPLMDVMFLVLVFFIYCISEMAVHRGVKVNLPKAAGAPARGETAVVTICADDSLQLNGRAMGRDEIVARLSAIAKSGAPVKVVVSGDRSSSLGCAVELLSALKVAGVEEIGFQTARPDGPEM